MLRNLLLALAAANILYFAWTRWAEAPTQSTATEAATRDAASVAASPTTGTVTAAAPPEAAAESPVCASLGPFPDGDAADRAAALLAGTGKPSRPRETTVPLPDGYWVYVGELRDAGEQGRTLAAIKRAGIDDAYAMPDDPQFRVSVGIFSERERAEQRARRVRALALDPKVEEHFKLQATQWLDFAGVAPAALQAPQLAEVGITDATLTATDCPL